MATGKSTVGRLLAEALDRPLLDSDAQVEAATGRTVREIWRADGEAAFRALETEALRAALAAGVPSVVAGAGGVVLAEANRELLGGDDATVVWLRASPATLLARVRAAGDDHRPLLDDDPAATLERMHGDRTPLYDAVADLVVDVDDVEPAEVARRILDVLDALATPDAEEGAAS